MVSRTTAFDGTLSLATSFKSASRATDVRHRVVESTFGLSHHVAIPTSTSSGWLECRIVLVATRATVMNRWTNHTFATIVGKMDQERTTNEREATCLGHWTPGSDEPHS